MHLSCIYVSYCSHLNVEWSYTANKHQWAFDERFWGNLQVWGFPASEVNNSVELSHPHLQICSSKWELYTKIRLETTTSDKIPHLWPFTKTNVNDWIFCCQSSAVMPTLGNPNDSKFYDWNPKDATDGATKSGTNLPCACCTSARVVTPESTSRVCMPAQKFLLRMLSG